MSAKIPTRLEDVTEYPLCWPDKPRAAKRQKSTFKASMQGQLTALRYELGRWRASGHVISMAPKHKGAVDPAVAVWFNVRRAPGEPSELRVLACDTFPTPVDNLHAIVLTLDRLRSMERYGTYSLWQALEGARPLALPPPAPAPATDGGPPWWEVLGVPDEFRHDLTIVRGIWKSRCRAAGAESTSLALLNAAMQAAEKELET